jgi:hypothetical protein
MSSPLSSWFRFGLTALVASLGACGCADLTEPGSGAPPLAAEPPPAAPSAAPAAPTPPPQAAEEQIGTAHILIMYKGSQRAPATVTRSKEEARKLAGEVLAKVKKGQDFAALAKQYTDEAAGKDRGGALPKFGKSSGFVQPFKDAAFQLKVGEVSGVVETDFGFHVIKRTE